MALNPQYEEIGKGFVQQYYAVFDDPEQRPNLVHLYNVRYQLIDMTSNFTNIQFISANKY